MSVSRTDVLTHASNDRSMGSEPSVRDQLTTVSWFFGLSLALALVSVVAGVPSTVLPFILALGPTVIAVALAWREGHGAVGRLRESLTKRPPQKRWYLVLGLPVAWALATVGIAVLLGDPDGRPVRQRVPVGADRLPGRPDPRLRRRAGLAWLRAATADVHDVATPCSPGHLSPVDAHARRSASAGTDERIADRLADGPQHRRVLGDPYLGVRRNRRKRPDDGPVPCRPQRRGADHGRRGPRHRMDHPQRPGRAHRGRGRSVGGLRPAHSAVRDNPERISRVVPDGQA